LNYDGNLSGPIVNGTNYTAADVQVAGAALPSGGTATVTGFGGGALTTPASDHVRRTLGLINVQC
jgi:hypothetical protein